MLYLVLALLIQSSTIGIENGYRRLPICSTAAPGEVCYELDEKGQVELYQFLDLEKKDHVHSLNDTFSGSVAVQALGASIDLGGTAFALDRCKSCREGNQLGFGVESRVALKTASAIIVGYADYKLRHGGHHLIANILRYSMLAIQVGAGVNNIRHGIKGR